MEYLAPGICGLLLIVGLVGVVMSRNVWRIPQLLLVAGILIGSVVFFWLAARTLKTHENWQVLIANYRDSLNQVEKGKFAGSQLVQKGIEQLQDENAQLNREVTVAMANRGRVWHNATRVRVSSDTGAITAKIEDPTPLGIDKKMVLFVFDDEDKGGKYLGEFVVTNVNNNQVELTPSMPLVQSDLNLISNSRGPWVFYEIMPVDSHVLFAQIQDAGQLKALLPESANKEQPQEIRDEYANDGKPIDPKEPDKVAVRSLRDYAPMFRSAFRQRNRLFAEKGDLAAEATLVEAAVAGVKEDVTAAEAEKADLQKDLQGFVTDRDAVTAYVSALQKRIEQLRVQLSQAFRSNIALAAELAQIQKRLIDEANRRNPPGQASDLRSLLRQ
jgi:hypothetical protein